MPAPAPLRGSDLVSKPAGTAVLRRGLLPPSGREPRPAPPGRQEAPQRRRSPLPGEASRAAEG